MYKIIGIAMLLVSFGTIIFKKAMMIDKKLENAKQIKKAITYIRGELSFSLPELPVLCRALSKELDGEVAFLFGEISKSLDENKTTDFFSSYKDAVLGRDLFSYECEKTVEYFFKNFGKKTLDIELDNINKTEQELELLILEEEQKSSQDKKLLYTLGASIAAVFIIFVI